MSGCPNEASVKVSEARTSASEDSSDTNENLHPTGIMEISYGVLAILWFCRRKLCRRKWPRQSLSKVMTCGPQMIWPCYWYKPFSPLGGPCPLWARPSYSHPQPLQTCPDSLSLGALPCSFMALAVLTARLFDPALVRTVSAIALAYVPTASGSAPRSHTPGQALGLSCIFKVTETREVPYRTVETLASQRAPALSTESSRPLASAARECGLSITSSFDPSREQTTLESYKKTGQFWKC